MSSVTQDVPSTTTTSARLVKVPITTKRTLGLSTSSTSMETGLEDMPPLDLDSDSGEDPDDESTMHDTPSYSPAPSLSSSTTSPMAPRPVHKNVSLSPSYSSSIQPMPILHSSKTSPTKSVAFSRPSFELDLEPEPKSTKGLRLSVTFDLDEHNCEQEEQDTQQPSMAALRDLALLSIESNSASHPHQVKGHPHVPSPSLLSIQLEDQVTPSKLPLSTLCPPEPLEAQGQSYADRLSSIENGITQRAYSTDTQQSSWAEPTHATKIASDTDNKNKSELAPPQETTLNHLLCPAPSEMLVALCDRPLELEALAAIHSDFFNLMCSSLCSNARAAFKTLLFTPRDAISDRDWMQAIAQRLDSLPCLLEKFKALVGWVDIDDTYDSDRAWNNDDDEYDYEDSLEQVEIKWFRDLDGFTVEVFEKCYPQFFINVRERLQGRRMSLGGDHRDRYVVFCETLGLGRQELACDNAWTRCMNGCLEKHPELLLQFKEIVAYEVERHAS
ncbi:hypothetical protein BG006_008592 [Podila minutissima]|uniref:Uncharacterized protein n=1 Tax=Podila minutissima TaxID=64525 RepID=A0A9P5VQ66_9FUNG|nr:hypothetical protein BG006_008592 [Podila minutissima]